MLAKVLNLLNPRKQSLQIITRNASRYGGIPPKPGRVPFGILKVLTLFGFAVFVSTQTSKGIAYTLESNDLFIPSDDDDDDD